jgi:hypothetical protein
MCIGLIVVVGIWVASLVAIGLALLLAVSEGFGLDEVVHKAVDKDGFKNLHD